MNAHLHAANVAHIFLRTFWRSRATCVFCNITLLLLLLPLPIQLHCSLNFFIFCLVGKQLSDLRLQLLHLETFRELARGEMRV